jgi:hypothetical protein
MRLKSILLVVLLMLVAGSVLAQDVRYNFDKGTDFSKFKTYKWVTPKGAERLNDMAERQVMQAIDSQLATKGLQRVEDDNADLYIAYQVALNQEKEFTSYSTGYGYGAGWGGRWYGGGGPSTTYGSTSTIVIGQLDLDMYDRAAKTMVWRGAASKTIDQKAKPDKQQKNLDKAVAKLLKNYPPPVKK